MTENDFDRYIGLYRGAVYSAALFVVKSQADADDIAQDVFLNLYRVKPEFSSDEHAKAWLLRCAVNESINLVRSYARRNAVPLEDENIPAAAESGTDSEVTAALDRLSPKLKVVMYLHYYEGYPVEETAKLLKISVAAVKWRLRRGREKLKDIISEEREEYERI